VLKVNSMFSYHCRWCSYWTCWDHRHKCRIGVATCSRGFLLGTRHRERRGGR